MATLDECPADNAPRNMITGEPIVHYKDDKPYLFLTRTIYLPLDAITEIRRPRIGDGANLITNRGLMRVHESYEDVLAAYNEVTGGAE